MKQREIPNEKYDYIYEMRTLCIVNNMIFLQCDSCKRVSEDIPNWAKLPSECMPETIEVYKQPQEVEDKLSFLLKEDGGKKSTVSYLPKKYGGLKLYNFPIKSKMKIKDDI